MSSNNLDDPGMLPGFEMDEFSDILSPNGGSTPNNKGVRTAGDLFKDFKEGLTRGFKSSLDPEKAIKSFLRYAAPEGYSKAIGLYDDSVNKAIQVGRDLEEKDASALLEVSSKFEKILPRLKDKLPEKAYERIKDKLEDKKESYKMQVEFDRAQRKDPLQYDPDRTESSDELNDVLGVDLEDQLEYDRAQDELENFALETDAKRDSIRARLEKNRFDVTSKQLGVLASGINRLNAFNDAINYQYQKRSIELQARQLLTLRTLTRLTAEGIRMNKIAYTAIVNNTAMADADKWGKSSKAIKNFGNKTQPPKFFQQVIAKTAGEHNTDFLANLLNNIGSKASSALGMVGGGSGILGMMLNQIKQDPAGFAGEQVGAKVGSTLQNLLLAGLAKQMGPHIANFSNKKLGGLDHRLSYGVDNLAAIMQQFANSNKPETGFLRHFHGLAKTFTPRFKQDDLIKDNTYQTIEKATSFNQMTQRSIVEIIPGYLSRQLQELRMLRTGDSNVAREVFDITRGQFVDDKTAKDNLGKRIVGLNARRGVAQSIGSFMGRVDAKGILSPEARHALEERLLRDAMEGRHFDPEAYIRPEGYAPGTSAEAFEELKKHFSRRFKFDDSGKLAKVARNFSKRQDYATSFNEVRDMVRSHKDEIDRILSSGNQTLLREMGIIITVEGEDKIDYKAIRELYRSGAEGTYVPETPALDSDLMVKLRREINERNRKLKDKAYQVADSLVEKFGKKHPKLNEKLMNIRGAFGDKRSSIGKKTINTFNDLKDKISTYDFIGDIDFIRSTVTDSKSFEAVKNFAKKTESDIEEVLSDNELVQAIVNKAKKDTSKIPQLGIIAPTFQNAYQGKKLTIDQIYGMVNKPTGFNLPINESKVTDIIIAGKNDISIKASEFINGELIDVTTNKVIENIDDIKGPVIDTAGNIRLTVSDIKAGLMSTTGKKLNITSKLTPLNASPQLQSLLNTTRANIAASIKSEDGVFSRVKDLYIEGTREPVIRASGIRAGEYINIVTGNIVETIDDITDSIAHVSNPSEVIVTSSEAAGKLVDSTGKRFKSSKLLRYFASGASLGSTIVAKTLKIAKAGVKLAGMFIAKRFTTLDAYLPGSNTPVLTSAKLKRGEYYDERGKVLTSFDDLRHGVFGPDGQAILTPDEVPNLINRDGTKHTAAKRRGILGKVASLPMKAMKFAGKMWWKGTKAYYKGLGNKVGGMFGKLSNKAEAYDRNWVPTPTDNLLNGILDVLDRRLPKEGPKKGSTEYQLAQMENGRRKGKKETINRGDKKEEKTGLFGMLKGLFAGKEDSEENDGDTNISIGDIGGGGDSSDSKKKNKPRGKLGRAIDKLKGSRLGKVAGRIGGSRLVQGALGLGRGALMMGTGSLLTGAGTTLAGAGSMLAGAVGGVATLGGALLSALASPVVLTGLAVGAAAYGGWKLYSRWKDTSGDLRKLRLLQYGFDSTGDQLKVLRFEALMESTATKGPNPSLNLNSVKPQDILEIFDTDPSNVDQMRMLINWIEMRFKPVFFTYLKALNALGSNVALNELDDKLPDELKYEFIEKVKSLPLEVTSFTGNPFDPEEPLEVSFEDIQDHISEISKKWKGKARDPETDKAGSVAASATAVTAAVTSVKKLGDTSITDAKAPVVSDVKQITSSVDGAVTTVTTATIVGNANIQAAMKKAAAERFGGGTLGDSRAYVNLTELQAVRVRTYGAYNITAKTAQALLETEAVIYKSTKFNQDGSGNFTGDLDEVYHQVASWFGVDSRNPNSNDAQRFYSWLASRFIPVAVAYFSAFKTKDKGLTPSRVDTALKSSDLIDVANAVINARSKVKGNEISVWEVKSFFIQDDPGPAIARKAAEAELSKLKENVDKERSNTPTSSAQAQENKDKSGSFTEKLTDGIKALAGLHVKVATTVAKGVTGFLDGALSKTKEFLGFENPYSHYNRNFTPGGKVEQKGAVFSGFAKGNGGLWTAIPVPKQNKSREAAMATLRAIEQMTGVSADLLATIISIESGFDYKIRAATSTAEGWFQFINKTWDEMISKHSRKYDLPPDDKNRGLRSDPRINGLMGAEFVKSNYKDLAEALGKAPTDTDIYLAHFMGSKGAIEFLSKDVNSIAAAIFPKQAQANRGIFFNKAGKPRTIGEIYDLFDSKVAQHRKGQTTDVASSTAGGPATQATADDEAKTISEASGFAEAANDPVMGEVRTGGGKRGPDLSDIKLMAGAAAAPLKLGDTGTRTASNVVPISTNSSIVDSGTNDPARERAREQATARAAQADKARAQEVKQQQQAQAISINYMEKQLETQVQMRDLLKMIVNKLDTASPTQANDPVKAGAGSNGMGETKPSVQERRPGTNPVPLSFKR